MTKREIGMMLAGMMLVGGLALWGAISAIDRYALAGGCQGACTTRALVRRSPHEFRQPRYSLGKSPRLDTDNASLAYR
jgi:hypothetical protein